MAVAHPNMARQGEVIPLLGEYELELGDRTRDFWK